MRWASSGSSLRGPPRPIANLPVSGMTNGTDRHRDSEASPCAHLIKGLHSLRIPVSDVWASRDWYAETLGFSPILDVEEEAAVIGVVIRHPSGVQLSLHHDPDRTVAMSGFVALTLDVPNREELETCAEALGRIGQRHSQIAQGHLGWFLDIPDPDGILVRLHTDVSIDTEEA